MNLNETLLPEEKQGLRSLQFIFAFITASVFMFLLAAVVFSQLRGPLSPELKPHEGWLLAAVAVFAFACSLWAKQQFAKAILTAKNSLNPLAGKLTMYRSALIVYLAISELPILFCIVLSIMTGNFVFQVYAAVLLGFMLSAMPRKDKVIGQLV